MKSDEKGKIFLNWTLGKNGGDQNFEAFLRDDGNNKIEKSSINIFASACGCDTTKFEYFTDSRDGHVYKTIKIGTQTWMAEDLTYYPYLNAVSDTSYKEPCFYKYQYSGSDYYNKMYISGILYNFSAAKISCPVGWHLPKDEEWTTLSNFIRQKGDSIGTSLKSEKWKWVAGFNTNSSCFSALPNFKLECCPMHILYDYGLAYAQWWSASTSDYSDSAWDRFVCVGSYQFSKWTQRKFGAISVRCIKD